MYRTLKPKQKLQNKLITHIRNDVRFNSRLLKRSSKLVLLLSKNKQLLIINVCFSFSNIMRYTRRWVDKACKNAYVYTDG